MAHIELSESVPRCAALPLWPEPEVAPAPGNAPRQSPTPQWEL